MFTNLANGQEGLISPFSPSDVQRYGQKVYESKLKNEVESEVRRPSSWGVEVPNMKKA
jgi:hypothetical protein